MPGDSPFWRACCKKSRLSSVIYLVLILLIFSSTSYAQELTPNAPSDNEVNTIAKQLYCPVCENTPLDVCPTQACTEWRELIREKLASGWDEKQIKAYFVDQFGDRVLATPPARGINWLVYIIPPLAFIFGGIILFRAFKTWKKPAEVGAANHSQPSSDEYVDRLEEELRKL
jgi:cytochrome c-type biogenesis protein CcmH